MPAVFSHRHGRPIRTLWEISTVKMNYDAMGLLPDKARLATGFRSRVFVTDRLCTFRKALKEIFWLCLGPCPVHVTGCHWTKKYCSCNKATSDSMANTEMVSRVCAASRNANRLFSSCSLYTTTLSSRTLDWADDLPEQMGSRSTALRGAS